MAKPPYLFWLSIAWVAITLLKGATMIDDGFRLLFRIGKDHIGGITPHYSKYEVWEMSQGLWTILGLLVWGGIFIHETKKLLQSRKNHFQGRPSPDDGIG